MPVPDPDYSVVLLAVSFAAALGAIPARSQTEATDCSTATLRALPLIERPATSDSNNTLVILLTGDGGWANSDEQVGRGLVARGAAVVGMSMRTYLGKLRSPEQAAADVACVARTYLDRWHRERIMLLGYSRGADIAPFVAARWPDYLRDRLNMVALVSLAPVANFQFHLIDLIRDVQRPDDVPIAPELQRLRGLRVTCIYGSDEKRSGCRDADSTIVTRVERGGGHRLTGGFDAIVDVLEPGLHPPIS